MTADPETQCWCCATPYPVDQICSARQTVVDRGWHRNPIVGPALRRLGRFVP
jgi:hypothetical protein